MCKTNLQSLMLTARAKTLVEQLAKTEGRTPPSALVPGLVRTAVRQDRVWPPGEQRRIIQPVHEVQDG